MTLVLSLMGIIDGKYQYMNDLLSLDACRPGMNPNPLVCTRGPSSLNLQLLQKYLSRHPDPVFASYIFSGLCNGFRIGFRYSYSSLISPTHNHPSSGDNPSVVSEYLREELRLGRLVGPIPQPRSHLIHTSPVGLVPKPHSDKWRLIIDLSYPRGKSVNDGISSAFCSLQYTSVDNAVNIITALGNSTELIKLDLSNAYRIVPVHPDDQPLLGLSWQGNTYMDRALPFGLRSAPKIFNAVADFLAWALHCEGVLLLIHYLDDFLIFGPPGTKIASTARWLVEALLRDFGAPIAEHKTEGPSTCITFLGIIIDTVLFQLRLPSEKVDRLQHLLSHWEKKRCCTRKELESLLGYLSHAATVVCPGRIFLRNLFSLLSRVSHPSHFICLNMATRADLAWWQCLLHHWNGLSFFPPSAPSCHVYSDGSGSFGCGTFLSNSDLWFQLQWPPPWDNTGISAKELVPIIVAAALWGHLWLGKHVCFYSDNEAVVTTIQRRSAKHPLLTQLMRCLFFYASVFQFHFSASHIPGVFNTTADAISRNNHELLPSLLPQASQQVTVPQSVSGFLLALPDWGSPNWTTLFLHSLPRAYPLLP